MLIFGAVTVPFYLHRAGLDYKGMFILEAIFSAGMMFFEIPTGIVADKFGRRISLFYGSLIFACSFLLFAFFPSFSILIIAQIICAFGMTLLTGADRALLYQVIKSDGNTDNASGIMGRYDAFGTAGMLLAFPLGSVFVGSGIVNYYDALSIVFIATSAAIALSAVVIIFVKEDKVNIPSVNPLKQGFDGFMYSFKHKKLRSFSLNYSIISALTFFMFWFYQSMLLENNFPVAYMGFVASGFNFSAMLLLFLIPFFERKIGVKNSLFISSILPGLLFAAAGFISGLPMVFIAVFGVTNLRMIRMPMLNALMNIHIEDHNRATVLSGISMVERIATALLYPVVGFFADKSLSFALILIGVITVFLSVVLRVEEESVSG